MEVSPEQVSRAKEAIDFLSTLGQRSSGSDRERARDSDARRNDDEVTAAGTGKSDVMKYCEQVLDSINRVKAGETAERVRVEGRIPSKRVGDEITKLFHQKGSHKCQKFANSSKSKCKINSWTHRFVCLAKCDANTIPTTTREKDALLSAGLGEKKIVFDNVDCNANEFKEVLFKAFSKLEEGGGYQLCKCIPNTRNLEALSSTTLSSPRVLQACGGNSRTYIRPLQKNLDLSRNLDECVTEKCLVCGMILPLDDLQDHVDLCKEAYEHEQQKLATPAQQPGTSIDSMTKEKQLQSPPEDHRLPSNRRFEEETTSDEELEQQLYQHAVSASLSSEAGGGDTFPIIDVPSSPESPPFSPISRPGSPVACSSLKEIVLELQGKFNVTLNEAVYDPEDKLQLEFRRSFVLEDALRHARKRKFNPEKTLKVTFLGESGEDTGGLRREFYRILTNAVAVQYCQGSDFELTFLQNFQALQANVFKYLGTWIAMSIVQEGNGFPVLCPAVYQYIVSGNITDVNIPDDKIPDLAVRDLVSKMQLAENDKLLRSVFENDDASSIVFETGYRKSLTLLTLKDRDELIASVKIYHCLIKIKAEIDQFLDGLKSLDVYWYIKTYPELMMQLFVDVPNKRLLTAEYIKALFLIKYSDVGTSKRLDEERTYMYFVDFLDECEDGAVSVTLQDILIFFTGADREPPTGFHKQPNLIFLYGKLEVLATASTCSLTLRLPTSHSDYLNKMTWSFKEHGGINVI